MTIDIKATEIMSSVVNGLTEIAAMYRDNRDAAAKAERCIDRIERAMYVFDRGDRARLEEIEKIISEYRHS